MLKLVEEFTVTNILHLNLGLGVFSEVLLWMLDYTICIITHHSD